MKVDLTVYVDEFGRDILAPLPSEPFGVGFFTCRDEDINALNEKLTREIPQKIHLRNCETAEEQRDMVKKVSCFLEDCGKDVYGGGVIFSKPEFFKIAEEYIIKKKEIEMGKRKAIVKNWGLHHIVGEQSKIVSISLALAYNNCTDIQIRFVFEETGNHQDYQKRFEGIKKDVREGWKDCFQNLYRQAGSDNNIPKIIPELDSCESKNNIKLAQLADVFAYITGKICRTDDSFSRELHGLMEDQFNLFDSLKGKKSIRAKGVFDVHQAMTKEMVIEEVSGLKR